MPDEPDPWRDLARWTEELLRGAADAVAEARVRLESREPPEEGRHGPGAGGLADLRPLWEWGKRHALAPLRDAVRQESRRWEGRAVDDRAAARVHEVFQALLEILEDEPEEPSPSRGRSRCERPGKAASGGIGRRSPAKRTRR